MARKPEDISQYQEAFLGEVKGVLADPKQGVLSGPLLRRLISLNYEGLSKEQVRALTTYITGVLVKANSPETAPIVGLSYPDVVRRYKEGDTDIFYHSKHVDPKKVVARHEEQMLEAQALLDERREEREKKKVEEAERNALARKEIAPSTASLYIFSSMDNELDVQTHRHAADVIDLPSPAAGVLAYESLAPINVLQQIASVGLSEGQLQALIQTLPDELIAYADQIASEAHVYAAAILTEAQEKLRRPGKSLNFKVQIKDSHAAAVTVALQRNHPEEIVRVEEVSRFPYKPYIREVADRWINRYTLEGLDTYTETLEASNDPIASQLLELSLLTPEQLDVFVKSGSVMLESGELSRDKADAFLKQIIFSDEMMIRTVFYNFLDAIYPVRYSLINSPMRFEYAGRALRFVTDLFTPEEMRELMTAPQFDENAYKQQLGEITRQKSAFEKQLQQFKGKRRNAPQAQQILADIKQLDQARAQLVNTRTKAIQEPDLKIRDALAKKCPSERPRPSDFKGGKDSPAYHYQDDVYQSAAYINAHYWARQALQGATIVSSEFKQTVSKQMQNIPQINRRL